MYVYIYIYIYIYMSIHAYMWIISSMITCAISTSIAVYDYMAQQP